MTRKHLALVLALLAGGCLNKADAQKVDAAQAKFWSEVAAKQYGAIWDEGAPELRVNTSKDDFVAFMQRIDTAYGACKPATKAASINVNANGDGYFTTQGFAAQCAQGRLEAHLTTVLRGGVAKVAGFGTGLSPPSSSSASSDVTEKVNNAQFQ